MTTPGLEGTLGGATVLAVGCRATGTVFDRPLDCGAMAGRTRLSGRGCLAGAALVSLLGAPGCEESGANTPAGDERAVGDPTTAGDPRSGGDDTTPGDSAGSGDTRIVADSCAEISAVECFANHECLAAERCQSVGPYPGEVVCCVVGTRGTAPAGTPCDQEEGELFCSSGICIDDGAVALCSKTCTTIADCPEGMKNCMAIAFSGSADQWCFPE